jgi:hypothetical protein
VDRQVAENGTIAEATREENPKTRKSTNLGNVALVNVGKLSERLSKIGTNIPVSFGTLNKFDETRKISQCSVTEIF